MNKINDGAVFVDLDDTLVRSAELYQQGCQFILGLTPRKTTSTEAARFAVSAYIDLMRDYRKLDEESLSCVVFERGAVLYKHEGKKRIARLRPGAKKFLKELKKHVNNVSILTTGGVDHQSLVANTLGILPIVDGMFNLGSIIPKFRWPVLVDDLNPLTSGVMAKMEKIGVVTPEDWTKRDAKMERHVSKFFCKIDPWRKDNFDDDIFEGVVSDILNKLSRLVRNNYWSENTP